MCTRPLKGWQIGFHPSGKPNYYITSYDAHHVEVGHDGKAVACYTPQRSPYACKVVREYKDIPCGRCVECRLNYSRQWADRCLLELQDHDEAYFVTFTYDNDHLPVVESIDEETGLISLRSTLVKEDMQRFFKRLRKHQKVRYFMCGEYGSDTLRAHYHAIIYGLHIPDLKFYKQNFNGDNLYTSEWLSDLWHNKGYVIIGGVTWESCAYVARYIMKKQTGKNAPYEKLGILPEYVAMSRRPGIGRAYYDEHKKEIYENEFIHISTTKGGKKLRPSRYYDKLYDADFPEDFEKIREKRLQAFKNSKLIKESLTDLEYTDMLKVKEETLLNRSRKLIRKEI